MASFLHRYVVQNFGLKAVSLLLALGLWLAVARDPTAEVAVTVPIEFRHIPENLEISSERIPEAQIRVRGPERLVRRLRPVDVHAEIDVGAAKPGERTFDLTERHVQRPNDLEVVQIVPGQVHVAFDTRLTRQVDVRPRVTGTFAAGYRIAQVLSDPATISITGPRQHVEAVEAATTDPIDASGTIERATFVTNVYVSDPLVQAVHSAPVRVTVIMEKVAGASNSH